MGQHRWFRNQPHLVRMESPFISEGLPTATSVIHQELDDGRPCLGRTANYFAFGLICYTQVHCTTLLRSYWNHYAHRDFYRDYWTTKFRRRHCISFALSEWWCHASACFNLLIWLIVPSSKWREKFYEKLVCLFLEVAVTFTESLSFQSFYMSPDDIKQSWVEQELGVIHKNSLQQQKKHRWEKSHALHLKSRQYRQNKILLHWSLRNGCGLVSLRLNKA